MLFMQGIPDHAAVNETVSLADDKEEAGFVNAVLRRARKEPALLTPPPRERDVCRHLSIAYSMPKPIVKYFLSRLGETDCEALLSAFNTRPPLSLRVNTCKITREGLTELLQKAGFTVEADALAPHGLLLREPVNPAALPGYREGLFFVQDTASQLSTEVLSPSAGERVLDLCACPGGKSFGAAVAMGDRGEVLSRDVHESKLPLIRSGAERLGLSSVKVALGDATVPDESLAGAFDRVIADVPCSGLGVLAKKPDLRYRDWEAVGALPALQSEILSNAASFVRSGGTLVYSTCTTVTAENEEVVGAFLAQRPDFTYEDFKVGGLSSAGGMLTLWPHIHHTDGFFLCKLRRL